MTEAIFILIAGLTVGSALVVAFSKKLIYGAFSLLLSLGGVAGLYVMLGADFVAGIQLLLYVGGILILILFAVMLTGSVTDTDDSSPSRFSWLSAAMVLAFLAGTLWIIWNVPFSSGELVYRPTTAMLGNLLLSDYVLPFEVISILLLTGLIGAIAIIRITVKGDEK
jgi:NADH-quinone oxidoreductase subunit J